jgi:hypothetical protein
MVVAFTPGYSWPIALSFTAICLSLYLFISQAVESHIYVLQLLAAA